VVLYRQKYLSDVFLGDWEQVWEKARTIGMNFPLMRQWQRHGNGSCRCHNPSGGPMVGSPVVLLFLQSDGSTRQFVITKENSFAQRGNHRRTGLICLRILQEGLCGNWTSGWQRPSPDFAVTKNVKRSKVIYKKDCIAAETIVHLFAEQQLQYYYLYKCCWKDAHCCNESNFLKQNTS